MYALTLAPRGSKADRNLVFSRGSGEVRSARRPAGRKDGEPAAVVTAVEAVTPVDPVKKRWRATVKRTRNESATVEFDAFENEDQWVLAQSLLAQIPDTAWSLEAVTVDPMTGQSYGYIDRIEEVGEAVAAEMTDPALEGMSRRPLSRRAARRPASQKASAADTMTALAEIAAEVEGFAGDVAEGDEPAVVEALNALAAEVAAITDAISDEDAAAADEARATAGELAATIAELISGFSDTSAPDSASRKMSDLSPEDQAIYDGAREILYGLGYDWMSIDDALPFVWNFQADAQSLADAAQAWIDNPDTRADGDVMPEDEQKPEEAKTAADVLASVEAIGAEADTILAAPGDDAVDLLNALLVRLDELMVSGFADETDPAAIEQAGAAVDDLVAFIEQEIAALSAEAEAVAA